MEILKELISTALLPPLVATLISLVACGIGALFIQTSYKPYKPGLVESFATGTLFISLFTMFFGFMGWMNSQTRLSLLFVLLFLGAYGWITATPAAPLVFRTFRNRMILVISVLLVTAYVLRNIFLPTYPPHLTGEYGSALQIASKLLQTGWVTFHPEVLFSSFPANVEMLYSWAIAYSPMTTAHYLNYICFIFLLLGTIRLGRLLFSVKIGWLSALVLASLPEIRHLAVTASAELWLVFYIVVAILAGSEGLKNGDPKRLVYSGIYLGAAAGVRYEGIIAAFAVIFALSALYKWKMPSAKSIQREDFIVTLLLGLAVAMPWYFRNFVWFANPFFPYFGNLFYVGKGIYGSYAGECIVDPIWYFQQYAIANYFEKGRLFSVLLHELLIYWVGLPIGLVFWSRGAFVRYSSLYTFAIWIYFLVFGGGVANKYMMISLTPIGAIMSSYLLVQMYKYLPVDKTGRSLRSACFIALIFAVSINSLLSSGGRPLYTVDSQKEYLLENLESYQLILAANRVIPEMDAAVGVMCGSGGQYADFVLLGGYDIGWANHRVISAACTSPETLSNLLQTRYNAQYLIVNEKELRDPRRIYRIVPDIPRDAGDFHKYFEEVARTSDGVVYHIKSPDALF